MKHRDFTFIIKDVKAGKKVAGHAKPDIRPMIYVAGAALFASLVLTMFYFQPAASSRAFVRFAQHRLPP